MADSDLSPEEQKKADEERKAREQAEQAALPYKWTQTIKDVDVSLQIDGKYKGRDLDVKISKNALKVGIKGQEPIIDVCRYINRLHVAPKQTLLTHARANCLTPSASTTPHGLSRRTRRAKRLACIWTR